MLSHPRREESLEYIIQYFPKCNPFFQIVGGRLNIPILMYHSISAQPGFAPTDLAVASADFRDQVEALKSGGYDAVLPRELILALDGKMRLPKRPVVFAFDDTLQSVHDLAFPILAEAGYRAVVYAVAGQIG